MKKNLFSILVLMFISLASYAQLYTWPVQVNLPDGAQYGCTFDMEISYCWQRTGMEQGVVTRSWPMFPSRTELDPVGDGLEPDGEFSPGTTQPIIAIEIGGLTLDANNQCACFKHNGCCFRVCINANSISVDYYNCNGSQWDPCNGNIHNY